MKNKIDPISIGDSKNSLALVKILNETFRKRDADKVLSLIEKIKFRYKEASLTDDKVYFCRLVKDDSWYKIQNLLDNLLSYDYPKVGWLLYRIDESLFKEALGKTR